MDVNQKTADARFIGTCAIAGAATMIVGAILNASSGTDLWVALQDDQIPEYLVAIGAHKSVLVANLSFWILGVLILGTAGVGLAGLPDGRPGLSRAAHVCFVTAVPLAIAAFLCMMALVVQVAPDTTPASVVVAEVIGWIGARCDDIATALIIGFGPLLIALAHRDTLPKWLVRWGYLAGAVGAWTMGVEYVHGLISTTLIIIPVGIGWMIATGIVMRRR